MSKDKVWKIFIFFHRLLTPHIYVVIPYGSSSPNWEPLTDILSFLLTLRA